MTDQVTIINSTLGKALGGASGACRVVPLGSQGRWGGETCGCIEEGSMDYTLRKGLG